MFPLMSFSFVMYRPFLELRVVGPLLSVPPVRMRILSSSNSNNFPEQLPRLHTIVLYLTTLFSVTHSIASNKWVIAYVNELERICKETDGVILRPYPSICLEGLRKTMKYLSQDSRSPDRDLNPGLPNTRQECQPLDRDATFGCFILHIVISKWGGGGGWHMLLSSRA
jgi:hypothetical protein